MLATRRTEIGNLAAELRKALDLEKAPFDVEEAVRRLGGTIHDLEVDGGEAMVKKNGDGFVVHVAPQSSSRRRRFSIAHELGHLFLHMGFVTDSDRWGASDDYLDSPKYRYGFTEEEHEAHEFAANLLMPAAEFRALVSRLTRSGRTPLSPIADHFDVSIEAARVRGQWLGLFDWNQ